MSRTKAVLDEYLQNKNCSKQNQHMKYVPVNYHPRILYPYDFPSCSSTRRVTHRLNVNKMEHKPNVRTYCGTYYIPAPAKHAYSSDESFYKQPDVGDHYIYQRASSNYYLHEPVQKTTPRDHHDSLVYLKYPKTLLEEKLSRYYAQDDGESGDYIRDEDFYEYDDNQNLEYYESNTKTNYDVFARNEEPYYGEYAPETSSKNRKTKTDKHSDYYSQYTHTTTSQPEKKHKYYYEENKVNSTDLFVEIPQKMKTTQEYAQPFLEPVKPDSGNKLAIKKSDNESVSTIYDLQSNNTPICKTCTVSSQTSDKNLQHELKESSSKSTQTLELDFTEKKGNLTNKETQTVNTVNKDKSCETTKDTEENETASKEGENPRLSESVIRWMQQIFRYFLWTMYNCPNPEQTVSFVQNSMEIKKPQKETNHLSLLPQADQKLTRTSRHRKLRKNNKFLSKNVM